MKNWVVILTLAIALTLINVAIFQKESLLKHGTVVYLKLAPVDPRSLMQGDYMALRFALANDIQAAINTDPTNKKSIREQSSFDGQVHVKLDQQNVARFIGINDLSKQDADLTLQYRMRNGQVKFATNAYFFEEGTGKALESAEYGEFKVGSDGELLLVALRDKSFKQIGQSALR